MKTPIKSTKSGFTLIEIVIVLAIAAVIIGLVFLIVPNAQRSARDTKIQSNSNALSSSIEQNIANNGGTVFSALTDIKNAPAGCDLAAGTPKCNALTITLGTAGTVPTISASTLSQIFVTAKTSCTNNVIAASTNSNQYSVGWWSESAAAVRCIGN